MLSARHGDIISHATMSLLKRFLAERADDPQAHVFRATLDAMEAEAARMPSASAPARAAGDTPPMKAKPSAGARPAADESHTPSADKESKQNAKSKKKKSKKRKKKGKKRKKNAPTSKAKGKKKKKKGRKERRSQGKSESM